MSPASTANRAGSPHILHRPLLEVISFKNYFLYLLNVCIFLIFLLRKLNAGEVHIITCLGPET